MLMVGHKFEYIKLIDVVGKCIFAKSLIGTTMQDGGTRERSDNSFVYIHLCLKIKS